MGKVALTSTCRTLGVFEHSALSRTFVPPKFLFSQAAGVDISDSSVKWLEFKPAQRGFEVKTFGTQGIAGGIVEGGVVRDPQQLGEALKTLQASTKGVGFAHAALPEEMAYVFDMHINDVTQHDQVRNAIEFGLEDRVPLKVEQAVFDYDIVDLHPDGKSAQIGVTVFPRDLVISYEEAFEHAGIRLLSLEIEARSIARAIVPAATPEVVMIADFGRARTGIAIIKNGMPIFTSTVMVGGSAMTDVVMETLGVGEDEAVQIKNETGISQDADPRVREAMASTAAALADEIARHYRYWDTKRDEHGNRSTPVSRVVLCGGNSNLKGLPEFLASRAQALVERGNVWENVCDFNEYIPPISKYYGLGYATAIGLALRSV